MQEAGIMVNEARVAAANEETTTDERVPDWISIRGSWYGY